VDCHTCGERVPGSARNCPSCQADAGFPNIRAAALDEEKVALELRMIDAETSTRARGCEAVLKGYGKAVLQSRAVICRNLGVVSSLVSSDNALYNNFYKQIEAESRLPEDNPFDRGRSAVDGTLFPNYHTNICFAALSLDNVGLTRYGEYSIVLKEKMILQRASVFEENSVAFCQMKHRIIVGDSVPPGYRATWLERDRLAMAKSHSKIDLATRPEDYGGILLRRGTDPMDDDFIEVHIWGPIHRAAIERVVGPRPRTRDDRVLWNSLDAKLRAVGAVLESR